VLIKGGAYLEALGAVKAVAFDKTGTLTAGEPVVTQTRAFACADTSDSCPVCDDVLALAAAVEGRSAHPLARAVMDAARMRGVVNAYAPAEQVETLAGRGVRGQVGGNTITVGSHPYFHELAATGYPHPDDLCQRVSAVEASGATAMLVGDARSARGFVAVADTVRPESRAVIDALHGMGMDVSMLTGDNAAAAAAVAAQLGVDDVRAGLLPEDKVAAVDALRAKYGSVVMVGDGINDTPALAAASVSVAMGGAGSPQALETADVALMADDLSQLPYALRLARFARRLIIENVALSFGVKAVFLTLAVAGLTSLWLAILADVGMLLVVALNGLRPLRFT
jgi:Cd2+/Zn2+-exporting ATPase